MAANIEYLTLTGSAAINGTGNALDNVITGNSGNNVLDGGGGIDRLVGGAGNDTYAGNSPVNFNDPSGYCFLGCFWNKIVKAIGKLFVKIPILATIVKVVATVLCGGPCALIVSAATSALVAGVTGGSLGQALRAGLITAVTAMAFTVVGDITGHTPAFGSTEYLANVAGHAGVGCLSSVASGGSCGKGAASAAVGATASPFANTGTLLGNTAVVAAAGGLASVAGGGKFANGAETAAFGYLFNQAGRFKNERAGRSGYYPDPENPFAMTENFQKTFEGSDAQRGVFAAILDLLEGGFLPFGSNYQQRISIYRVKNKHSTTFMMFHPRMALWAEGWLTFLDQRYFSILPITITSPRMYQVGGCNSIQSRRIELLPKGGQSMRGYAGISMSLSACVHFVRNDEVGDEIKDIAQEVKKLEITCAYIDCDTVGSSAVDVVNCIGEALQLEHAPYRAFHCAVRFPWVPFLDDLISLSKGAAGLVIVINNADKMFSENRNGAFDLIESFLVQFHHWFEKKKPCHLCFQMQGNDLVRQVFGPASKLRVVR